jgi:hypothetical protein
MKGPNLVAVGIDRLWRWVSADSLKGKGVLWALTDHCFPNVLLNFAEPKKPVWKRLFCRKLPVFYIHTQHRTTNGFVFILFFREAEDSLSITVIRCTSVNLFLCLMY